MGLKSEFIKSVEAVEETQLQLGINFKKMKEKETAYANELALDYKDQLQIGDIFDISNVDTFNSSFKFVRVDKFRIGRSVTGDLNLSVIYTPLDDNFEDIKPTSKVKPDTEYYLNAVYIDNILQGKRLKDS